MHKPAGGLLNNAIVGSNSIGQRYWTCYFPGFLMILSVVTVVRTADCKTIPTYCKIILRLL